MRVTIDTEVLTNIGSAIRGVEGTTELIAPQDMSAKISKMSSGGIDLHDYFTFTVSGSNSDESMSKRIIKAIPTGTIVEGASLENAFNGCINLTRIDNLDTSNVTTMKKMCRGCTSLTSVAELNTSNVTTMQDAFFNCNLTSVPFFDLSKCTDTYGMLQNNKSITSVPAFDLSKVTNARQMVYGCTNLRDVPVFNLASATTLTNMFGACNNLSNESINNILASLASATSFTGSKALSTVGIDTSKYGAAMIAGLSNYSTFTAAGWSI